MDMPELYHYGREKYWFRWQEFFTYMLDGIYQVSGVVAYLMMHHPNGLLFQSVIIFFFIMFSYQSTSARKDGWSIDLYEWSTVSCRTFSPRLF